MNEGVLGSFHASGWRPGRVPRSHRGMTMPQAPSDYGCRSTARVRWSVRAALPLSILW
jgi:hypothetical protein